MTSSVTATFVFTDLVDSTATSARLGPTAAEELRSTHFRLLRSAIASSGGTEVKNLGDGLMVVYSSPSRALAGAVGMQQAIERHNRTGGEPMSIRVGISTGETTEEDGDYFGDPVVEAARLCNAAHGGQILAAELVRLLVGRRASQSFEDRGALDLKGLPEPVPTVEVLWEPTSVEGAVPLPGRLAGAASDALFGFFGRDAELAELDGSRKAAHTSRQSHAVFVSGEAGMGKTALVSQFTQRAHADGAVVLFGHADADLGVGYQPWIEAMTSLVRHGDADVVASLRPAQRSALGRLVPDVADPTNRVADPDVERLLLFEAVVEVIAATSEAAPVIVVLDDVHWADGSSLQLLRHVLASTVPMDVTVVCTYRDTDLVRGDPLTALLADLRRSANVSRLALHGLGDDAVLDLLVAAAGHSLDRDGVELAHALRNETEGNPFFTTELLRHLVETGGIAVDADGRWILTGELDDLGLPSSVRDVVGRRVERLGDEALRVLCLAAVIGREFDLELLASVADVEEDPLLDLLDAGVAAALLTEGSSADRYRFTHGLIQHSLYEELSPARRQRAHRSIGLALEATPRTDATWLAEAAHHWVAATHATDVDKALGYVRRAGDAARDALAPEDAIRWYRQALELLGDRSVADEMDRAEILARLGAMKGLASHEDWRDDLAEASEIASRHGDVDVLVEAALGYALWQGSLTGDPAAKPVIQTALDATGLDPTPVRARLLAALAVSHEATSEWRERRELALEAVEVARATDDDATFVDVVDTTNLTLATPEDHGIYVTDVERAVVIADRLGDPVLRMRIRYPLMWVHWQRGDTAEAASTIATMQELAGWIGLPYTDYLLAQFITGHLVNQGRTDDAEAANERLLEIATRAGAADVAAVYGGLLTAIRWQQGRLDELVDFFIEMALDNPSVAALRSTIPCMLAELGRLEEARRWLADEEAAGFDFPRNSLWLVSMVNLLDAAVSTGGSGAAAELAARVAPYADLVICPAGVTVNGAVARALGRAATVSGDLEAAEEHFVTAHRIHARLGAPYWTARAELDHAELCLARRGRGDVARARELATKAAGTSEEFKCAALLARAEELLTSD